MKDKELKVEETESSFTLGGAIKYTSIHQSCWCTNRAGFVVWTDAPACMQNGDSIVEKTHIRAKNDGKKWEESEAKGRDEKEEGKERWGTETVTVR